MFFTDEQRAVYEYHDGERERRADPLSLRRALLAACRGDIGGMIDAATPKERAGTDGRPMRDPPEEEARLADAQEAFRQCVRQAFGLAAFDPETGKGCTGRMADAVWAHYCGWLAKKA